jgi:hypothetical protein
MFQPALSVSSGGLWNDQHGFIERYSAMGSAGRAFDPGDSAADQLVAQHHPQISAFGRRRGAIQNSGSGEQAR